MKLRRTPQGFTLIELLVVISIIAVLAGLSMGPIQNALVRGQLIQTLSNARQIYTATFNMYNDGASNSDSSLGWPGDLYNATDSSAKITNLTDFVSRLVKNDYLKVGDLKIFTAPGISNYSGQADAATGALSTPFLDKNSAFKVYLVADTDQNNTLFLATKNYTYNNGTNSLNATYKPYGDKGFVVIRKGGDAAILRKSQAQSTGSTLLQQVGNVPGVTDQSTPGTESATNCFQTQQ